MPRRHSELIIVSGLATRWKHADAADPETMINGKRTPS
jgi:hypothetical protein